MLPLQSVSNPRYRFYHILKSQFFSDSSYMDINRSRFPFKFHSQESIQHLLPGKRYVFIFCQKQKAVKFHGLTKESPDRPFLQSSAGGTFSHPGCEYTLPLHASSSALFLSEPEAPASQKVLPDNPLPLP